MLKQITAVISDAKTNIRDMQVRSSNGQANIDVILDIADLKHLENIINGVRKIPGVHDVQRLQKGLVVGRLSSAYANGEQSTDNCFFLDVPSSPFDIISAHLR